MIDLDYHEIIFSNGPTLELYQSLNQNLFLDLICIGHLISVRHCVNVKWLLFIVSDFLSPHVVLSLTTSCPSRLRILILPYCNSKFYTEEPHLHLPSKNIFCPFSIITNFFHLHLPTLLFL